MISRARLPKSWAFVALGDLATDGPTNGYSPAGGKKATGTKTLRLTATTSGHLILNEDSTKRVNEEISPTSKFWLEPGDLLVQRSNTLEYLGAAAIYDGPEHQYIYPDLMMRLRFAHPATTRWVWRYLNTAPAKAYVRMVASGTAGNMPKINGLKLKALEVPLPPLPEQRHIAAILDKADAIRHKRREAIRLTEELLRSAFLEMFGDPVTNPMGWPTTKLGEIAQFVGGGTPSRKEPRFFQGDICWASAKDIKTELLEDSEEHITEEAIDQSATKLVAPSTILVVVKSKVLLHRLPVAIAKVPVCFGQDLKGIIPDPSFPVTYLARHLRVGQKALLRRARGVNTEGLTLEHLRAYQVMVPSRGMTAWDLIEQSIIKLNRTMCASSVLGNDQFNSLVQRAFSGGL